MEWDGLCTLRVYTLKVCLTAQKTCSGRVGSLHPLMSEKRDSTLGKDGIFAVVACLLWFFAKKNNNHKHTCLLNVATLMSKNTRNSCFCVPHTHTTPIIPSHSSSTMVRSWIGPFPKRRHIHGQSL